MAASSQRIAPMLAKLGTLPPRDDGWAYEFKWDGIRAVVQADHGTVQAASRGDKDITPTFPELAELAAALADHEAVLDGELVAFDDAGRPSFGRLQQRLNLTSPAMIAKRAGEYAASYLVFDILRLDGRSLLDCTYDERRDVLESLDLSGPTFATPASFRDVRGADVLSAAESGGLEGVMAKRRASTYRPGERTSDWLKIKIVKMQEVVIGGWTEGEGERAGSLGALLLGVYDGDELRYAGKVGTGFDARKRKDLLAKLGPLQTDASPFVGAGAPRPAPAIHFVEPVLVGEVNYGEWTSSGSLRHTSWRGLRIDKEPREVSREDPPA